jgi:uncharacterized repeat protein (TIGR01451 family)
VLQVVAAERDLTHSPGRMIRTSARFRPHSPRHWLALPVAALVWAWPAAGAPELTATGAAVATGTELLETSITVEKRRAPVGTSGIARFAPVDRLAAGEEAFYTIRVRNPGKAPASDVQVTKRMPDGMEYIEGSATGPDCEVQFSTDGGDTFHARAEDAQYTHLRWILRKPLPPGATALLRFRAVFH